MVRLHKAVYCDLLAATFVLRFHALFHCLVGSQSAMHCHTMLVLFWLLQGAGANC